jgi:hypothetical protein
MLPAAFKDMYYLILSVIVLISVLYVVYLDRKITKRVDAIEKKLFPYLKDFDEKNYRLWKTKLKLEKLLAKHRKPATI